MKTITYTNIPSESKIEQFVKQGKSIREIFLALCAIELEDKTKKIEIEKLLGYILDKYKIDFPKTINFGFSPSKDILLKMINKGLNLIYARNTISFLQIKPSKDLLGAMISNGLSLKDAFLV